MEDTRHPFYTSLNLDLPKFKRFDYILPMVVIGLSTLYYVYLIPTFELTQDIIGYSLSRLIFITISFYFLVYVILLYKKPSLHYVNNDCNDDDSKQAIQRSKYAYENDCHCYDVDYPKRYCYLCQKFVSQRTFHCKECQCCIELKDHHCDFFGFCVGRHNMLLFIVHFIVLIVLCIMSILAFIHFLFKAGVCYSFIY